MCWPWNHKWKLKARVDVKVTEEGTQVGLYQRVHLECAKCGDWKHKNLR